MIDLDRFQLEQTPVVPMPRHQPLEPDARGDGHRYLVAGNGVYVEVMRAWVHAIVCIGATEVTLPFGNVWQVIDLRCGPLPRKLLEAFRQLAIAALPNETAALILWSKTTGEFRLLPTAVNATPGRVDYFIPALGDDEFRVVDIHSHGKLPAYFSKTDNADDRHDVKIAVCMGNVDTEAPSIAARACILGKYLDLSEMIAGVTSPSSEQDIVYEPHVQTAA